MTRSPGLILFGQEVRPCIFHLELLLWAGALVSVQQVSGRMMPVFAQLGAKLPYQTIQLAQNLDGGLLSREALFLAVLLLGPAIAWLFHYKFEKPRPWMELCLRAIYLWHLVMILLAALLPFLLMTERIK